MEMGPGKGLKDCGVLHFDQFFTGEFLKKKRFMSSRLGVEGNRALWTEN